MISGSVQKEHSNLHKVMMTSVIDEGKEQHTQRQRDEGRRDKGGPGGV